MCCNMSPIYFRCVNIALRWNKQHQCSWSSYQPQIQQSLWVMSFMHSYQRLQHANWHHLNTFPYRDPKWYHHYVPPTCWHPYKLMVSVTTRGQAACSQQVVPAVYTIRRLWDGLIAETHVLLSPWSSLHHLTAAWQHVCAYNRLVSGYIKRSRLIWDV